MQNAECRMKSEESRLRRSSLHSSFCILRSAFIIPSLFLLTCSTRNTNDSTLKFWGLGHEGEVVSKLMPEFERRTGIHVDVQQIPWTAAHEKLLTGFVGNGTPDVAQMGNTWIPEFV
ncbi:MAG: extracellular solute-binding protein, partial [Thermoanaerobaculia bacterium]